MENAPFLDSMVNRIYPSELPLNKANVSDTEASYLDLHLSISDGFVKTKMYDKRDDFDIDIVMDEIWDLIESVSEGFPTSSFLSKSRFIESPGL